MEKTLSLFIVGSLALLIGVMAMSPALAIDYGTQNSTTQTQTQTPTDQTQNQTPTLPNTAATPAPTVYGGLSSSVIMWVIIGLLAVVVVVALVAIASRGSTT